MRTERLYLAGWMPFAGEHDLELPPGPIAVIGEHDGDPRRSNRAGKTALLEAVTWCLFGVRRKRLEDSTIHRDAGLCEVVVDLGELVVSRKRARGASTRLQVNIGGEALVGDAAQLRVHERIGLRLDDYLATVCFRQGEVESIVSRTAGERLTLVSEWLQLSRWASAEKVQAGKLGQVEQALESKRSSLGTLEGTVLGETEKAELEAEQHRLEAEVLRLQQALDGLKARAAEIAAARVVISAHGEMDQLRGRATALRAQLAGKQEADKDAVSKQREAEAASQAEQRAREELEDVAEIEASGFDGRCPVMCEQCPVKDAVEQHVRSNTELYTTRSANVAELYPKARELRSAAALARAAVTKLDRTSAEYTEVTRRGKELRAQTPETAESAQLVVQDGADHDAKFAAARQDLAEASEQLGEARRSLIASAQAASRCEDLRSAVAALEESSRVSSLALRAVSQVPADIAREELLALEAEANLLLSSAGVSLRFSWARELLDKAPSCENCGHVFASQRGDQCPRCKTDRGRKKAQELEILCDDGSGLEEDVRFNSGGTRAIVGASIRLAASALLRRLRSAPAAWAIVDEPFGSLDSENREQLARSFAGMLGSVGLEQALVVSHDPVLLSALPSRIVVDKRAGASTVRVEQ